MSGIQGARHISKVSLLPFASSHLWKPHCHILYPCHEKKCEPISILRASYSSNTHILTTKNDVEREGEDDERESFIHVEGEREGEEMTFI
jgi:hypothetical protein